MINSVIALDLGTGGVKASLFTEKGEILQSYFHSYETLYPKDGFHEQRPNDWWKACKTTIKKLVNSVEKQSTNIVAISTSGHSLGVVPVDAKGDLLRETTPIWSDRRGTEIATKLLTQEAEKHWYSLTGNGFPKGLYPVFKILWTKEREPRVYEQTKAFIGTKDYINLKLTGVIATDFSDASGSGVFDLKEWKYSDTLMNDFGFDKNKLAKPIDSTTKVGTILPKLATELGLPKSLKVIAGGVDNSCMALGARGIKNNRIYTSLGSSAWVAITSERPVLETEYKPYVFAHVIKGYYNSATAIFSAGSSLRWVRDLLFENFDDSIYTTMAELAVQSPIGANGITFNPSLAGASSLEKGRTIFGAFTGLKLSSSRADILRATYEGITANLQIALKVLCTNDVDIKEMLIVGGGAKDKRWMQQFADIFNLQIQNSVIDQEAASLGAAALAFVGCGLWKDYEKIDKICSSSHEYSPIAEHVKLYLNIKERFAKVQMQLCE